jgi:hypothetical protein
MDDEVLKLECLKTAQGQGLTGDEARREAQRIFDWLKNRPASNPGYGPPAEKTQQARVVGRDGRLEPPFDDYVKE